MTVVERSAQREGLQHVAVDVEIACEIGFGDVALVESSERAQRPIVAKPDMKLGLTVADGTLGPIGQLDGERRRCRAHAIDQGVDRRGD